MRSLLQFLLPALLLGAACATSPVVPEALNTEFKPLGEVYMRGRGASFDEVRVRSPRCNLSKRADGSWAGTLNELPVDANVDERRVVGGNLSITRETSEGRHLIITGQFDQKIYRFEIDENRVLIRGPKTSATFDGMSIDGTTVRYGAMKNFELRGQAGDVNPPWPQIAFALMGAIQ